MRQIITFTAAPRLVAIYKDRLWNRHDNLYDVQVTPNQTLYYVTTAVHGNNESGYSNEAAAAIP